MAISVYATNLQCQVELLPSVQPVTIYVCGVTPYDGTHIGHAATFVTYDILARRLSAQGTPVNLVRNITDLDDPILPAVQRSGLEYWSFVTPEIAMFMRDMEDLHLLRATHEPRASEEISEIIESIRKLEDAGATYRQDGTVYFRSQKSPCFGSLSGLSRPEMIDLARERGGNPDDMRKQDALDSVLWRPAEPGEPEYSSPFGLGHPGWHIGCMAMVNKYAELPVLVHGGGEDLVFPHHEAEMAMWDALGTSSTRYWHHCAFVSKDGVKMSKSLGNTVRVRELVDQYGGDVVRMLVMQNYHYKTGWDWDDGQIPGALSSLAIIRDALAAPSGPPGGAWRDKVCALLDDDLRCPEAVLELESFARAILSGGDDPMASSTLRDLVEMVGFAL